MMLVVSSKLDDPRLSEGRQTFLPHVVSGQLQVSEDLVTDRKFGLVEDVTR